MKQRIPALTQEFNAVHKRSLILPICLHFAKAFSVISSMLKIQRRKFQNKQVPSLSSLHVSFDDSEIIMVYKNTKSLLGAGIYLRIAERWGACQTVHFLVLFI